MIETHSEHDSPKGKQFWLNRTATCSDSCPTGSDWLVQSCFWSTGSLLFPALFSLLKEQLWYLATRSPTWPLVWLQCFIKNLQPGRPVIEWLSFCPIGRVGVNLDCSGATLGVNFQWNPFITKWSMTKRAFDAFVYLWSIKWSIARLDGLSFDSIGADVCELLEAPFEDPTLGPEDFPIIFFS